MDDAKRLPILEVEQLAEALEAHQEAQMIADYVPPQK